jgi:hypothetical protein
VYVTPPVIVQQPRYYVVQRPVYVPPPPMIVYQPAYVQQQYMMPPTVRYGYAPPAQRDFYMGFQGSLLGSIFGAGASDGTAVTSRGGNGMPGMMGGAGLGMRFRTRGVLGGELALSALYGRDYNGDTRLEVPLTLSGLFYLNPQNAFQVYLLAGIGASYANVRYETANQSAHGGLSSANYGYLGGLAGIGAEVQITPRASFFFDVRGFVRTRLDRTASTNPEFARNIPGSTTTQTTNASFGAALQAGAIFYF